MAAVQAMTNIFYIAGTTLFVADGLTLRTEADAVDLVSAGMGAGADWVAVTTAQLSDDFFRLSTGLAGAIVQKLVNYHLRLAIMGNIDAHLAKSSPLRDFVGESNRGHHLWFVSDLNELQKRLGAA